MKARNIIKVLLSAALVFAATVDCSAQFLNNLKGKLKEAVVEKVSQNSNVAAAVAQKKRRREIQECFVCQCRKRLGS